MPTRPARWTLYEWGAFAARCRAVRDDLDSLIREFPETPGVTARLVQEFIRAHQEIVSAMIGLETPIEKQVPELTGRVVGFIHGENGTINWNQARGRVAKDAKSLTRAEWSALGDRIKAIRLAGMALGTELQAQGLAKARTRPFSKAVDLTKARMQLEGIATGQHPDWQDVSHVFFGPASKT